MFLKICTEEKVLKHLKKPYARRAHLEQDKIERSFMAAQNDKRRDTEPARLGELLPSVMKDIKTRIKQNQLSKRSHHKNPESCESMKLQPKIYV